MRRASRTACRGRSHRSGPRPPEPRSPCSISPRSAATGACRRAAKSAGRARPGRARAVRARPADSAGRPVGATHRELDRGAGSRSDLPRIGDRTGALLALSRSSRRTRRSGAAERGRLRAPRDRPVAATAGRRCACCGSPVGSHRAAKLIIAHRSERVAEAASRAASSAVNRCVGSDDRHHRPLRSLRSARLPAPNTKTMITGNNGPSRNSRKARDRTVAVKSRRAMTKAARSISLTARPPRARPWPRRRHRPRWRRRLRAGRAARWPASRCPRRRRSAP